MGNISRDFAPPFKLIAPYFFIGTIIYFLAVLSLFTFDTNISITDFKVVGWVHLYMLGFVMMVIFGAMAQLVPVVIETGHSMVELFYIIWPTLLLGTVLMVIGFTVNLSVLPFGGTIVLMSMMIFALDLLLTIKKGEHKSIVVNSMLISNLFLILGILSGFVMSLSFSGLIEFNPILWLKAHVFAVFGGYVIITIMGISMVLLPMFGLSHGFNDKPIKYAFYIMIASISLMIVSSLFEFRYFEKIAIVFSFISMLIYFYQIYLVTKSRARKMNDIWVKSLAFAFFSLIISLVFFTINILGGREFWLVSATWFLMVGFVGFLITAHLYKIIPFLVWFERFAPLVGKQKVPLLNDMVPRLKASAQMTFSMIGTVVIGFSFLFKNDFMFKSGISFLLVGSIYLVLSVKEMMNYSKGA